MVNVLERKGLVQVGDYFSWHPNNEGQTRPASNTTIIGVVPKEGTDVELLMKSLTDTQHVEDGKNLLDDPKYAGKFKPDKLYVLEY
jgi:hypothetical protein